MRRRFFVDRFESDSAALRGETADHLGRVLRAEPGQLYELSDGQSVWLAKIERVALSKRGDSAIEFALVEPIDSATSTGPALALQLLISLIKFDRFEWCLEKATELGAAEIVPMLAARIDKPLAAAAAKRQERWQRILVESAQQSRRLRPPTLQPPVASDSAFAAHSSAATKILLSERPGAPPLALAVRQASGASPDSTPVTAVLAIGPEGGWTDAEFAAANVAGFAEASLGENILRAETAVITALAVMRFALAP
jgi:16S rRNA (uracil1498-N3)-methyltransferase